MFIKEPVTGPYPQPAEYFRMCKHYFIWLQTVIISTYLSLLVQRDKNYFCMTHRHRLYVSWEKELSEFYVTFNVLQ
jgi:hypothetical protein